MTRCITDTQIKDLAAKLNFTLCAVTPANPTDYKSYIKQWLSDQKQGQMHYLENYFPQRTDPTLLLPNAKSIICIADRYHAQSPQPPATQDSPTKGKIARYAWGKDYHKVIKKRLHQLADQLQAQFPQHQFKSATDTAPILEREHATRAGLGWTGKHTLLIHPNKGSYLLLGQIVTTLPIDITQPHQVTDHCGTCTRCIQACPTDAIDPQGYTMDGSKCISYLTLEHREPIPDHQFKPIQDWIAGCDICQEVCPHNLPLNLQKKSQRTAPQDTTTPDIHPDYAPRPYHLGLDLLTLLHWNAQDRQTTFTQSALKRMKLEMIIRNALIASYNSLAPLNPKAYQSQEHTPQDSLTYHQKLYAKIMCLADDEDQHPLVTTTANQVLKLLSSTNPQPLPEA